MTTRTALGVAVACIIAGAVIGHWWPDIWAFIGLIVAPLLTAPYFDKPPASMPEPPPRPHYDDKDDVKLEQDAAHTDTDYRAAVRRAKAARARLRRRLDGTGDDAGRD